MLLGRDEIISTLFLETDRTQRMKTPLAVIHCGIHDWAEWGVALDQRTVESAISKIAELSMRLLRCYDSIGKIAEGELLFLLPGCNSFNAATMAERLNTEVFALPVELNHAQLPLTACFGVAASGGRSPYVVLRDAERALQVARNRGAGTVYPCPAMAESDSLDFLHLAMQDQSLDK
jgi:GGDEF domain-containing protein